MKRLELKAMLDNSYSMTSIVYNQDCLEAMRQMKDNEFDLAVDTLK